MAKIVVLGGGRIGRVIARDLADDKSNQVTVTDFSARDLDEAAERWGYQVHHCDLSDKKSLINQVEACDIVVGALPGAIGLEMPVIPREALFERGGLPMVKVLNPMGQTELRLVRLGEQVGEGEVVILAGVRPGDRVLLNPRR